MIFKIVLENEIYRLRKSVSTFQELQEVIQTRFGEQLYKFYCVEYVDVDGDKVRINCQEDYEILLEEHENSKTVKIFIKEDLNQSTAITFQKDDESVEVLSENEQEQVIVKEEVVITEPVVEAKPVVDDKTQETTTISTEESTEEEAHLKHVKFDSSILKLEKWSFWLDAALKEDNPLMILWKLKKIVQQKIHALKDALNVEHKGFFKQEDWKMVAQECRKVARKQFTDDLPTEVNYDDIKSHLLSLECTDNLQAWIIFKITIQRKINKTRDVIKSIPELKEKWQAFHDRKNGGRGGCHGNKHWRQFKGQCWNKKKEFFKRKFEEKFEESIKKMLPTIAQQVAQILKGEPQVEPKIEKPESQVVHKGYICDGCGMSPIVGVCYKSSVVPDFDFCSKCEATKPHEHPFLKLKTPEQRPLALFSVINEEGQEPFQMDSNKQHEKVLAMMIEKCKQQKSCYEEVNKQQENWARLAEKKAQQAAKQAAKKAEKKAKQAAKQAEKKAKQAAKQAQKKAEKLVKQAQKKAEKLAKQAQKKAEKLAKKAQKKVEKEAKKAQKKVEKKAKQISIVENLMAIFQLCEEKKDDLLQWVTKTKMMDVNKLANKFLSENLLVKFGMTTTKITESVDEETTTAGFENTPENDPEPVVVVKEIDQVALANANQLMEIFSVASEKKDTVYDWVVAKNNTQIQELVNDFLAEMLGKF